MCGTKHVLSASDTLWAYGKWSLKNGPGSISFNPGSSYHLAEVSIGAAAYGTYELWWQVESGACPVQNDSVIITFNPLPALPATTGDSACGSSSITLEALPGLHGTGVRWYNDSASSTVLINNNQFVTPVISASATFWASSFNASTGCEGPREKAEAAILSIPGEPTPHVNPKCGPGSYTISASIGTGGTTNLWYNHPFAPVALDTSKDYLTQAIGSTTMYYVSTINWATGCESPRDSVQLIIHPLPVAPVVTDTSHCGPASFNLYAETGLHGDAVYWFAQAAGGTAIFAGNQLNTSLINNDTVFYAASINTVTGCQSTREKGEIRVLPIPDLPTTRDTFNCGPGSLTLKADTGRFTTGLRWYTLPTGGTLFSVGDSLETPFLTADYTYYVSAFNGNTLCESARKPINIDIVQGIPPQVIIGKPVVNLHEANVIYAVDEYANVDYLWDIPGEITINQNNGSWLKLEFPNLGSYEISVQLNNNGCPGPVSHKLITVTEGGLKIDLVDYSPQLCEGHQYLISPRILGGTPPYAYQWLGNTGQLSDTNMLETYFDASTRGSYQLILKVTDFNYKTAQDTLYITVHPNPTAAILTDKNRVCVGDDMILMIDYEAVTGNNQHLWTGQVAALSSTVVPDPVFAPFDAGPYNLHYMLIDENNCVAHDSVVLFAEKADARFEADKYYGCSPLAVNFTNTSTGEYANQQWSVDTVTFMLDNPAYSFINASPAIQYKDVSLTIFTNNGCKDTYTSTFTVYPNPKASITASPTSACSPVVVSFASLQGNLGYSWDFGDGTKVTTGFATAHAYQYDGTDSAVFNIKLNTVSPLQCSDSTTIDITVFLHQMPISR
ncbi:MAG: hypothetical protein HC896_11360 [Bacteroidales bacterium]|nr:hypothetical protein [Bacteroidales bacterium]